MSGAQKFSLSLLISVVAFSGFAVLAWSGLFDYIETTFYLDRVQSSIQVRVDGITEQSERFHRSNINRFAAALNQTSVRRAFETTQNRDDIEDRADYFDALQTQLPSLDYVRFVDLGGNRLHFSTREADFTEGPTSRVYTPLSVLDATEAYPVADLAYPAVDTENTNQLIGAGLPSADLILLPSTSQFIYRFPVLDEFGLLQGAALFYLHTGGLSTWLVRDGLVGAGDEIGLITISDSEEAAGGVLVNGRSRWLMNLSMVVAENWGSVLSGDRPILPADERVSFALFSGIPETGSASPYPILYLFPEADLQMTDIMKVVLLAAIFLTVFLLVFLLFNMRQDAVVVLSDRVKRFQISLLREYMENKQDLDFQRWRAELEDRRGEVATQIRRGIGRVRASQREEVDKLIDSSWDEILEVLGSRTGQSAGTGVDLERLEDMVERVIGNLQSTAATRPGVPADALPTPTQRTPSAVVESEDTEELEELGAEVVEELAAEDEVAAAPESGKPIEVEELTEEEFEAEELDEMEELEDVEELGAEDEVAATPEPGKPIEVEELTEEEFEAEELGEMEELEDVEELAAEDEVAATPEPGKPIEVEELTEEEFEAEELDEMEELEDVEELGAEDEVAATPEPGKPIEVEELTEEEFEAEELAEMEELEDVEELEAEVVEELGAEDEVAAAIPEPGKPMEVEELTEEEFQAEELAEMEELEDVEELEAEEEVAAAPEPGKPIEVEELTEEEFEAEELAEMEELEDVEELEAEVVEELGAEEEVATAPEPGKPIEVEELTEEEFEAEELVEMAELEDLEPAEGIEGAEEPDSFDSLPDSDESFGAPAIGLDAFDEATELSLLAEAENLDIASVSLDDVDAESTTEVPFLEGESIGEDDGKSEDDQVVLEEIDYKAPPDYVRGEPIEVEDVLDSDDLPDEAEELELADDLESLEVDSTVDSIEELEHVESVDSTEVGDLEGARPSGTPFMAGTFSFGKGTALNMPSQRPEPQPPADDVGEELETLAPVEAIIEGGSESEEVISAAVEELVSDDRSIRFGDGLATVTSDYEIASVSQVLDRLHIDKNIIVERDGVVEIDGGVFAGDLGGSSDETRELVDSVMGDGPADATAGIEALFSVEAVDLFADLNSSDRSEAQPVDTESSVVRFVERGFDYDGFLRGYNKSEGGVVKSLVTFTRYWGARVGVLLGEDESALFPKYGLGLESECQQSLRVSKSSGVYRNVLEKRLVLFVNHPLRRIEYFSGLCPDEQVAYFQKVLFLPVILEGEEGYAMLGVQDSISSLDEAFKSVVPFLNSVATVS